jgi:hypothetical protein
MKTGIKITNEGLYEKRVIDIDASGLRSTDMAGGWRNPHFEAHGTLSIEVDKRGNWKDITGEHGAKDYEEEYGFQLVCETPL